MSRRSELAPHFLTPDSPRRGVGFPSAAARRLARRGLFMGGRRASNPSVCFARGELAPLPLRRAGGACKHAREEVASQSTSCLSPPLRSAKWGGSSSSSSAREPLLRGIPPPPGRPRLPLLCSARPVRPSCWGPQPGDEHQGVHRKTCSARAEEPLQRGGPKDEASVVRRTCSALGFFYNLKAQASSKRRAVQFPVPVQYRAEWPVQCPITFGEG
jgi:hypothetical protein